MPLPPPINYAAEGRIRELAAASGVRIDCLEDVVNRFRAGQFKEIDLPEKLAEWRSIEGHHFFAASGIDHEKEAIDAFGPHRSLTAQGAYLKKHGAEKASEVAAAFGTTLAGKPGTVPKHFKTQPDADADIGGEKKLNPWSNDPRNLDQHGRYSANAISRQASVVKSDLALGERLAKAAHSSVGAVRPARVA